MFGLCMPTGETYLRLINGKQRSVMLSDETNPRKHIMANKYVLQAIQAEGYKNVEAIVYQPDYHYNKNKTVVTMAEYYYEHADELED